MPDVAHEVFLDLEGMLSSRLENAMSREIAPVLREIENALEEGDFDAAIDLVTRLDVTPAVTRNIGTLDSVALAALFLGVSRLGDVRGSAVYSSVPQNLIDSAVEQTVNMLTVNANRDIQKKALQLIAQTEAIADEQVFTTSEDEDSAFKPTPQGMAITAFLLAAVAGASTREEALDLAGSAIKVAINNDGKQFMNLGSSLLVSRLSALGFLEEASAQGLTRYQVSEILDDRICPVCLEMHGKTFSVRDGLMHTEALLSTPDPDLLRSLAPWPNQSKAGVEELSNMSEEKLVDNGFLTPPYHPGCRGIIVEI